MRVASKMGNLSSKFGPARPLDSRIIRYVRDGRTDKRTDKSNSYCPLPYVRGHNNHSWTTTRFAVPTTTGFSLSTSAKADVMRSGRFGCLCTASHKKSCMDLHEIFDRSYVLVQSQRFTLEVIQIDRHCHLDVSITQQGHFGIKSTVAQKRSEIRPHLL